jgi:LysM repeat protein
MIKLLIIIGFSLHSGAPSDSLGVETINGKTFVIHKVDEKETLYAIARRYRTTVDAIREFNTAASSGLEIGLILKVPYSPKIITRPSEGTVHTVAAKETLFSISKKYGVSTDEIKQWNSLSDNTLSIGQELVIKKKNTATTVVASGPVKTSPEVISKKGFHTVGAQETVFSIAKQYGITMQQLKDWNHLEGSELKIGQTLYVTQPEQGVVATKKPDSVKTSVTHSQPVIIPVPEVKKEPQPEKTETVVSTAPIRISESVKNGSETIESGVAELIEGTESNRKYLALHRTAPIGTILKVKNEMNNREVFVRVMGKLPDTALTDKVIIRISKSAYDRLGAIDQRFRVEVTYYK